MDYFIASCIPWIFFLCFLTKLANVNFNDAALLKLCTDFIARFLRTLGSPPTGFSRTQLLRKKIPCLSLHGNILTLFLPLPIVPLFNPFFSDSDTPTKFPFFLNLFGNGP